MSLLRPYPLLASASSVIVAEAIATETVDSLTVTGLDGDADQFYHVLIRLYLDELTTIHQGPWIYFQENGDSSANAPSHINAWENSGAAYGNHALASVGGQMLEFWSEIQWFCGRTIGGYAKRRSWSAENWYSAKASPTVEVHYPKSVGFYNDSSQNITSLKIWNAAFQDYAGNYQDDILPGSFVQVRKRMTLP